MQFVTFAVVAAAAGGGCGDSSGTQHSNSSSCFSRASDNSPNRNRILEVTAWKRVTRDHVQIRTSVVPTTDQVKFVFAQPVRSFDS